jgi:hypothetical protein
MHRNCHFKVLFAQNDCCQKWHNRAAVIIIQTSLNFAKRYRKFTDSRRYKQTITVLGSIQIRKINAFIIAEKLKR